MDVTTKKARRRAKAIRVCRFAFWWTLCVQIIYVIFEHYSFTICAYLPDSFQVYIHFWLFVVIFFTRLFSIFILILFFRTPRFMAFYPVIIICVAYAFTVMTNSDDVDINTFLSHFRVQREHFVHEFCSGNVELEEKRPHVYAVPENLKYEAGTNYPVTIFCEDDKAIAFFVIWADMLHSKALMYRSDDSPPEDDFKQRISSSKKLMKNWHYVSY